MFQQPAHNSNHQETPMERTFFTASAIFAFVLVTAIVVTKREPQAHAAFEPSQHRPAR